MSLDSFMHHKSQKPLKKARVVPNISDSRRAIPTLDLEEKPHPTVRRPDDQINLEANTKRVSPYLPHPTDIEGRFIVLRGRLRLGGIRKPWKEVLWFFASAGVYWGVWISLVFRELNWHRHNSMKMTPRWVHWFKWIPILHILPAICIVKLVQETESQNHYRFLSFPLACLATLLPFAFMPYVQLSINRHWLLHCHHIRYPYGKRRA